MLSEPILISPVVVVPRVKLFKLVEPIVRAPPESTMFPAIEAVGVPLFTFMKANLALSVDCPPINTSTVEFLGKRVPLD